MQTSQPPSVPPSPASDPTPGITTFDRVIFTLLFTLELGAFIFWTGCSLYYTFGSRDLRGIGLYFLVPGLIFFLPPLIGAYKYYYKLKTGPNAYPSARRMMYVCILLPPVVIFGIPLFLWLRTA